MATIDDIVKKSGVSRSTVFRFLNGNNVRESSKQLIVEAMKDLNYKMDKLTKSLNLNFEISVSPEYMHFQGFTQMVQGVMEACEKKDIKVNLVIRSGKQIDEDYSNWVKSDNKGVLIIGKNKEDEIREAKFLKKKNIPHIFINHRIEIPDISYVCVDFEKAAYDVVNYLINKGHRDILVIGNPQELLVDELKINGYLKAMKDNDIEIKDKHIIISQDSKESEKAIRNILVSKDRPTAYFGICDSKAIKFINIARTMGFSIPEDISVVGMDNVNMAEYSVPPLTSVEVNFKSLGEKSVEQLINIIKYDFTTIKAFLSHSIIERESVRQI
ncbi:MAG: LacI family transcriptional regulator [Maledivibacter sp.]|jgi:LacI family transcriptional regulator|nr:LacI family transcriptional regulator [Maledivibacter sp.]